MNTVNLRPFLRSNLGVLFVALNPPAQSNANGHYFSGSNSRFFELLFQSGLITERVPKANADEVVFGSNVANHGKAEFGIVDLVDDVVETNSSRVRPSPGNVDSLLKHIRELSPRFVCVIHSKVRDALNSYGRLTRPLTYGPCGAILPGSATQFVLNYFPNGNSVDDETKLRIFRELRDAL